MSTTGFETGCLCRWFRTPLRIPRNPRPAEYRRAGAVYETPRNILLREMMGAKIAVAGAGIYGATAAIRLAEQGHEVHLFDPLGMMQAASAINQYRVHA